MWQPPDDNLAWLRSANRRVAHRMVRELGFAALIALVTISTMLSAIAIWGR